MKPGQIFKTMKAARIFLEEKGFRYKHSRPMRQGRSIVEHWTDGLSVVHIGIPCADGKIKLLF